MDVSRRSALEKELFEVKLHEPMLVQPLEGAPQSQYDAYFLTNLDQTVASMIPQVLYAFDADANKPRTEFDPAMVMKEALQKVLVHYYPLAGRLCRCPQGKLIVHCNGDGVLFVTADASIKISDLGDLDQADPTTLQRFVYPLDPVAEYSLLLTLQVTKFKCGGLLLGMVLQHCMLDAIALAEFVNSWAETARGVPLSTPPVLDRSFLKARAPLRITYPHTEFLHIKDLSLSQNLSHNFVHRSFSFTEKSLEKLKKKALDDAVLSKCSAFEALCAFVWRARTKAMGMKPEQMVKLIIGVDGRSQLEPAFPRGYMGNGIWFTCALASAGELEEKPLSHIVKHVQDAIAVVTDEYTRSQVDYIESEKLGMPATKASMMISAWYRVPFYDADFGWGAPKHVGPVVVTFNELACLLSSGKGSKGINMVIGLPFEAMEKFDELLHPEWLHQHGKFIKSRL